MKLKLHWIAALLFASSLIAAQTTTAVAPVVKGSTCPQVQQFDLTFTASGQSLTIANDCGAANLSLNYEITGTPAPMSIVAKGCVRGKTTAQCDVLDTNTNTTNSKSTPLFNIVYDYFTVTPTWTGGGVTVNAHSTSSPFAKNSSTSLVGDAPVVVSGGHVSCPTCGVGTGNMSNSGTPTVNQFGVFIDSTHIKGVTPAGDVSIGGNGATTLNAVPLPNGMTATTQSPSDNSTKVGTTAYADASVNVEKTRAQGAESGITSSITAKADDSAVVHKTGDESIAGQKQFSGVVTTFQDIQSGLNSSTEFDTTAYLGFQGIFQDQDATPTGIPDPNHTWVYTLNGTLCTKDSANNENCIGAGTNTINVNGVAVVNPPNFNDAVPAADVGYQLAKWLVLSHSISVEVPIFDAGGTGLVAETASKVYANRTIVAAANSGTTVTNGDGVAGNPTLSNPGIFKVVYSTTTSTQTCPSSPCTGVVNVTPIATTPASTTIYRIGAYVEQVALGVACTGNSTLQVQVNFTAPNAAGASSIPFETCAALAVGAAGKPWQCGGGALGQAAGSYSFQAKASTSIAIVTTYTSGAACTTNPDYKITPIIEQL